MIFWFICLYVSNVDSVVLLFGLVDFRVKDWSSKPCPGCGDLPFDTCFTVHVGVKMGINTSTRLACCLGAVEIF